MRKRTVRTGLRLLAAAVTLLLLGTFYSQQLNSLFALPSDGAFEFVRLAFFWGGILGGGAIVTISVGLVQRSRGDENIRLFRAVILVLIMVVLFFTLFYRSLTSPLPEQPLRPGETLII
jgi:glucan phosphoethanolaminetransferase (alkaline phosphatase superfamily)